MPQYPIDVLVDPKNAKAGVSAVNRALGTVEGTADRVRNAISQAFAFAGVTLGVKTGIDVMRSFSQEISTVAAVSGASADELKLLSDRAKELGGTTRFSATEAAGALGLLSKAGFSVKESLESVGATLTLAQAGGLGLESAADIASSTLRGFRLETSQTARVADVLAQAANATNSDVTGLGEGLKFVAPVAAGLNVSLEQTVAAMGTLSDAGLQASLAGTGLRRILAELESPAKMSQKILKEFGVTADEVKISQVGLTTAIQRLADAGLDTGAALEVFGDRGGPAFEVLSKALPKVDAIQKRLESSGGSAAKVAKIMDDNLNGAFLGLESSAEAVVLAFAEFGGQTVVLELVKSLTNVLRFMSNNIDDVVASVAVLTGGFVAFRTQLFLTGQGITSYAGLVAFATKAVNSFNLAIAKNPLGFLIIGLTTVISALVLFRDQISLGSGRLANLGDLGVAVFTRIQKIMKPFIDNFYRGLLLIAETFDVTIGKFDLSFTSIARALAQTADTILGIVKGVSFAIADGIVGSLDLAKRLLLGKADGFLIEMTRLGSKIVDGFREGFEQSFIADSLEAAFADAEKLARERARKKELLGGEGSSVLAPLVDLEPPPAATRDLEANESRKLTVSDVVAQLDREAETLRLGNREREVRIQLDSILDQLSGAGVTPDDVQQEQIRLLLEQNQTLADQASLLDEIKGPQEQLALRYSTLNDLLAIGSISSEEYAKQLRGIQLASLDLGTDLESGLVRGFLRVREEMANFGSQAEGLVSGTFNGLTEAVIEFTRGSEDAFASMVDNITREIQRLLLNQLFTLLLNAAFPQSAAVQSGGGGFNIFNNPLTRRQEGGPVAAGRGYLVGENGPEAFVPGQSGSVIPNQSLRPSVNLSIVNVTDPNQVSAAINSGQNDQAIVNVLQRNAALVRNVLESGG